MFHGLVLRLSLFVECTHNHMYSASLDLNHNPEFLSPCASFLCLFPAFMELFFSVFVCLFVCLFLLLLGVLLLFFVVVVVVVFHHYVPI